MGWEINRNHRYSGASRLYGLLNTPFFPDPVLPVSTADALRFCRIQSQVARLSASVKGLEERLEVMETRPIDFAV